MSTTDHLSHTITADNVNQRPAEPASSTSSRPRSLTVANEGNGQLPEAHRHRSGTVPSSVDQFLDFIQHKFTGRPRPDDHEPSFDDLEAMK